MMFILWCSVVFMMSKCKLHYLHNFHDLKILNGFNIPFKTNFWHGWLLLIIKTGAEIMKRPKAIVPCPSELIFGSPNFLRTIIIQIGDKITNGYHILG